MCWWYWSMRTSVVKHKWNWSFVVDDRKLVTKRKSEIKKTPVEDPKEHSAWLMTHVHNHGHLIKIFIRWWVNLRSQQSEIGHKTDLITFLVLSDSSEHQFEGETASRSSAAPAHHPKMETYDNKALPQRFPGVYEFCQRFFLLLDNYALELLRNLALKLPKNYGNNLRIYSSLEIAP